MLYFQGAAVNSPVLLNDFLTMFLVSIVSLLTFLIVSHGKEEKRFLSLIQASGYQKTIILRKELIIEVEDLNRKKAR